MIAATGHRTRLEAYLSTLPDRCPSCLYHERTQGHSPRCDRALKVAPVSDKEAAFGLFRVALLEARRPDGTVHACDVRPLTHGRIESRLLSSCWSKARRDGLLIEAGHERSDDVVGRNSHRMEAYYELRAA